MTDKPAQQDKPDGHPDVTPRQLAKLLLEVGPIAVFFIANAQRGLFWGTGAFMVATAIALVVSRQMLGKIPIMPLISGAFVLVFGGLTLLLQDEIFIKMKPTIVNVMFAMMLFGGLAFGHSLIRLLFEETFRLTEQGWRILTVRWAVFFLFLAVLNELIWRTQTTDFWITFKIWGIMPLTMLFAIAQVGVLKRYEA